MLNSLPATISKVSTMEKNIIRIVVDSQELHQDDAAELFRLKGNQGWFYFHEAPIKEIDTKSLPPITLEKNQKSPSERYRSVLFAYHAQEKITTPFNQWYEQRIEALISQVKEKLV